MNDERCRSTFTRKRPTPGMPQEQSKSRSRSIRARSSSLLMSLRAMARVWSGVSRCLVSGDQLAVDPGAEDVARLDVQVGRAALDRRLDDLFHGRSPRSRVVTASTLRRRPSAGGTPSASRTSRMVSPAMRRAAAAPSPRIWSTRSGCACSSRARSRIGASVRDHVVGQHPLAVEAAPPGAAAILRHLARPSPAARSTCAGGRCCRSPGVPGSFLVTRAGSVLAGRSFCQISSGVSSSPMVLPRLLDILAWPSSPMIRLASVSSGLGSGKKSSPAAELGVPLPGDLAGQLEVLGLILAHRHQVGPVEQDVGRHQHRVVQQAGRDTFESLRLIFELRHPLQLADRRDAC